MEKLIIIGAGPAGLSAAIYAARAQLAPLLIQGPVPGGQLTLTTEVENYPGFPKGVLGTQLMTDFRAQAERFGTRFAVEEVSAITRDNQVLTVKTQNQNSYQARAVLIATGANARWLNLESETRLRGKGVSACATCDGFFFRDKTVAIVGGGDTAMEEANFLTKFAKQVYLVHRRNSFRASKIMQERILNNPKIKVVYNAQVQEVLGTDKVTGLKLKISSDKGETKSETLAIEGLFVAIGHQPATAFLKGSSVVLDDKGYIFTSAKIAIARARGQSVTEGQYNFAYQYSTLVPGIFAAGDCVDHEYRQAGVAVGMGIAAELEIEKYLNEQNA
ncbi:thioredoxin-disulfide reductase [Candidatus Roizmanbacteria bacterium RIFOXYC1_FULL_41_16]|nr:MAG: thioredoxin-disulfide reductase [Candidatus Roizmanbacteria bacterium RIFOXYB1_FULL_41_27]OGK72490.1 MAG: thioredoxin-disulfide reductase [Candidatus Roizmanbacteria bacterium RIFOXYC1_FULL_41_16]